MHRINVGVRANSIDRGRGEGTTKPSTGERSPGCWLGRLDTLDAASLAGELKAGEEINLEGQELQDSQVQKLANVLEHASCPVGISLNLRGATVTTLGKILQAALVNQPLAGLNLRNLRIRNSKGECQLQSQHITQITALARGGGRLVMLDLGGQILPGVFRTEPFAKALLDAALKELLTTIGRTGHLQVLRLDGCGLCDPQLEMICSEFFATDSLAANRLIELGLACNFFQAPAVEEFIHAVGNIRQHRRLNSEPMSSSSIAYKEIFVKNRSLEIIDLSGMKMTDGNELLLLEMASNVPSMRRLEPYSSAEVATLSETGKKLALQLRQRQWPGIRSEVEAMALSLSHGERSIPPELINEIRDLMFRI